MSQTELGFVAIMALRITLLFLLWLNATLGQSFTNLDFELPSRRAWPPPTQWDRLFPGWTRFLEPPYPEYDFPYGFLDDYCIGSPCIGLYSKASFPPIQGKLMLGLDGGGGGPGGFGEMGLRQVGLVPTSARSLRFKAYAWGRGTTFAIRIGGRQLSLIPSDVQTNYTAFMADISFASGVVSELSLAVLVDFARGIQSWAFIDDVQFSSLPAIPPSDPPSISIEPVPYTPPSVGINPYVHLVRFTGLLEISESAGGPFTEYPGAVSPYWASVVGEKRFYRTVGYPAPIVPPTAEQPSE